MMMMMMMMIMMMIKMFTDLHVKYRCYFCQILIKLEYSRKIFEKYSNIKFYENTSVGNQVVPR